MPVTKIIVTPITDGPTDRLTVPAQVELEFFDVGGNVQCKLRCDQQGGEYPVTSPFEYFNVQGKIWAFDRSDTSLTKIPPFGSAPFYTLVNCGRKGRGIRAETVTIHIVLDGPSPVFHLCAEINDDGEHSDPAGLKDLTLAIGLSERSRIVNVLQQQAKQIEDIRGQLERFSQTYLSTLKTVEELQQENAKLRREIEELRTVQRETADNLTDAKESLQEEIDSLGRWCEQPNHGSCKGWTL